MNIHQATEAYAAWLDSPRPPSGCCRFYTDWLHRIASRIMVVSSWQSPAQTAGS